MTYASPADIREAVAPDGNPTGTCAELSDAQIQRHIQRGQDLVDASTGKAFNDTNVPDLLKGLVIAFGAYYATLAYRKSKDLAQFDPVYLLYQDARQVLTGIQQGELDIAPQADNDPAPIPHDRPKVINPLPQNATMFTLHDVGLAVVETDRGPRISDGDCW